MSSLSILGLQFSLLGCTIFAVTAIYSVASAIRSLVSELRKISELLERNLRK